MNGPEPSPNQPQPGQVLYPERFRQTRNISARGIRPRGVVFHHSGASFQSGENWIMEYPQMSGGVRRYASYHCFINTDGERIIFAKDQQRTWHAGDSRFNGKNSCNDFMLGCSFTGDTNTRDLTEAEMRSAAEWLFGPYMEDGEVYPSRWRRWGMSWDWITDHRTVGQPPGRKNDLHPAQLDRLIKMLQGLQHNWMGRG